MDRTKRARLVAATVTILLIALAACSSDVITATSVDDPIDQTDQATSAPAAPTPEPVATSVIPTPVATPPSHPWYECDAVQTAIPSDYRVTNIPADDPDGGLVAHVAPGVDATVTEVLPDGTDELDITGCQQNLNIDAVWWLVDERGWVNARYLEAHVPGGPDDWQPGLSDLIDAEQFAALIGLEAPDLDTLETEIGLALGFEDSTVTRIGEFTGVDARGGFASYDVLGLRDDSVNGYRLDLTLDFLKDDTATDILGFRVARVDARAICGRGVGAGGLCV